MMSWLHYACLRSLLVLMLLRAVAAATRTYNITLAWVNLAPDGVTRPVRTINGVFPGLTINVTMNDMVVVNVFNNMTLLPNETTSVHWHGLFQHNHNNQDGVVGVTQCGLPPGQSSTYSFPVPNQHGTFWYHSHKGLQYAEGVAGPFIIQSPNAIYVADYDEEIMVAVQDWYHSTLDDLLVTYLSPASDGNEPVPDSGLINGRGRFNCSSLSLLEELVRSPPPPEDPNAPPRPHARHSHGRRVDWSHKLKVAQSLQCTPNAPHSTFSFVPGRRYRLRFINPSAFTTFSVWIDQHNMTVIEMDGVPTQKVTVPFITINIGQRYSVIVEANGAANQTFWMRAQMLNQCFPVINPVLNSTVLAVVHYSPSWNGVEPTSVSHVALSDLPDCNHIDPKNILPNPPQPASEPVSQRIALNISFQDDASGVNLAYLNDISFQLPTVPALYEVSTGANSFAASSHVTLMNTGGVVEIVYNNFDTGDHPFHLHGLNFQVLGYRDNDYMVPGQPTSEQVNFLNYDNPPIRDVVSIPIGGWVVIRFVANNSGIWFMHCHMEWHLAAGLALIMNILPRPGPSVFPETSLQLCGFATDDATQTQMSSTKNTEYIIIGSVCGIAALVGVALLVIYVRRRQDRPSALSMTTLETHPPASSLTADYMPLRDNEGPDGR